MTVYVDDARIPARVGRTQGRWSHLTADTTTELLAFASQLGLKPQWIQRPGQITEHFDVTDSVREQAITLGAKPISLTEASNLLQAKRAATKDQQ